MAVPSTLDEIMIGHTKGHADADAEQSQALPHEAGAFKLHGGETAALARLAAVVKERPAWVCAFSKPATHALEYAPGSTSMLSPYLKFGCLSCRTLFAALEEAVRTDPRHTTPPQSLHGQLYFVRAQISTRRRLRRPRRVSPQEARRIAPPS